MLDFLSVVSAWSMTVKAMQRWRPKLRATCGAVPQERKPAARGEVNEYNGELINESAAPRPK